MSAWVRVPSGGAVVCGGCGAAIPPGAVGARVALAGVRRALWRCADCAGPAPAALPEPPPPAPRPRAPLTLAFVPTARLAFDWRARAAGREPGEEG